MYVDGLIIGFVSFAIIGLFHPMVIACEYHFGVVVWPIFLILGLACGIVSLSVSDSTLRGILGLTAFSFFWSIYELFAQRRRVRKGWFPKKPAKK